MLLALNEIVANLADFEQVCPHDHEELPDINMGNSHRLNMTRNVEEQRARMGGEVDWNALDDGTRRGAAFNDPRRGGRSVVRGGGVAGTQGRRQGSPQKS